MSSLNLLACATSKLFAQVSATGQLTLVDRYGTMAAILDESASNEEIPCLDRIL